MDADHSQLKPKGSPAYEVRDAQIPMVVWGGVLTFAILGVSIAAMYFMFGEEFRSQPKDTATPFAGQRVLPPAPRLQTTPYEDLKRFQADVDTQLSSFGWVDKQNGVVRIPIERAIDLSVERVQAAAKRRQE